MFNLQSFLMQGFLNAVGKMADYQIILNASGWFEKGVLYETDLAIIQEAINNKNEANIMTTEEPVIEDSSVDKPIEVI